MDLREKYSYVKEKSKLLSILVKKCQNLLETSSLAEKCRIYLGDRINETTIKEFELGYFPNNENLSELNINFDDFKLLNIFFDKNVCNNGIFQSENVSIFHNHNLIIPYYDMYGNVISLVGRTLLDEKIRKEKDIDKYKNSSCSKNYHLFNLNRAKKSIIENNFTLLVEGQFDVMQCFAHNIFNVVAIGSCHFTLFQALLLRRYTNNFVKCFDNDEAGHKASAKIDKIFEQYKKYINIFNVSNFLQNKDIDMYLRDGNNSPQILLNNIYGQIQLPFK